MNKCIDLNKIIIPFIYSIYTFQNGYKDNKKGDK